MGSTAKGQPNGLATLDSDGNLAAAQIPAGAAVADVATADATGTYGSGTADLINETKDQLNALLASLRDAGLVAE